MNFYNFTHFKFCNLNNNKDLGGEKMWYEKVKTTYSLLKVG